MCLYLCPSTCVYPRDLCFLCGELLCFREPALDFFFSCLGVGLRSKASVCQYLVIVCASIFIFHSVWSPSACVRPNYITWPCPLHPAPPPHKQGGCSLLVAQIFLWATSRVLVWLCSVPLSPVVLSNPSHISALVSPFGVFSLKEMLSTHTAGLRLARMFCGCCVWYKG